jgi:hypothetical protein
MLWRSLLAGAVLVIMPSLLHPGASSLTPAARATRDPVHGRGHAEWCSRNALEVFAEPLLHLLHGPFNLAGGGLLLGRRPRSTTSCRCGSRPSCSRAGLALLVPLLVRACGR